MTTENKTADKIVQAAIELIARRGYHSTSIKSITDSLGLTKPAIYAHFSSKAEIARQIMKLYDVSYLDPLIQSVNEQQGSALDKLSRLIRFAGKYSVSNLNLILAFISLRDQLRADPEFELLLTRLRIKHESFIAALFRTGIQQGLIKKGLDPVVLTSLHVALTRGLFEEWIIARNKLDGTQLIKSYLKIFFKGIEA